MSDWAIILILIILFLLAIFVCPLGYLIGAIGSMVLIINKRTDINKNEDKDQ